jgi:hypothetical protein
VKVIYIAGRFRGKTPWDVEQNVRKAEAFSLEVAHMGGMPLCPHANTRFFDGQLDDQFWIEGTAELLRRCDAIALVPGNWLGSVGTAGEIKIAEDRRMPIFLEPEGTPEYNSAVRFHWRLDLARFCRGS